MVTGPLDPSGSLLATYATRCPGAIGSRVNADGLLILKFAELGYAANQQIVPPPPSEVKKVNLGSSLRADCLLLCADRDSDFGPMRSARRPVTVDPMNINATNHDATNVKVANQNAPSPRARTLWAVSLVCAALTMGLTVAHVLELFPKMSFGPVLWTTVEHNLYGYFALVGGSLEVATVVLLVCLLVVVRRTRPVHWFVPVSAGAFAAALASWFAVVQPANAHIGSWALDAIPPDWTRWRAQWEYGHAIGFVLMLAGFLALVAGVLQEIPSTRPIGSPVQRTAPVGAGRGRAAER